MRPTGLYATAGGREYVVGAHGERPGFGPYVGLRLGEGVAAPAGAEIVERPALGDRVAIVAVDALDRYERVVLTGVIDGERVALYGTSGRIPAAFAGDPSWARDHGFTGSQHDGWSGEVHVDEVGDVGEEVVDLLAAHRGHGLAVAGLGDHLERELGPIARRWTTAPDGSALGVTVVEFAAGRIDDAVVYSTFGLSDHVLDSPVQDGAFRLELLMIVPESLRGGALPFVLGDIASTVAASKELPAIGALFRNVRALRASSAMDTLYVGRPLYFPAEWATYRSGELVVNIDWLVPVSAAEAAFIEAEGWRAFEALMYADEQFDPIDLGRASLR